MSRAVTPGLHHPPAVDWEWRSLKWRSAPEDFERYVRKRNAFFNQSRTRAALLKGGIVWRLAVEVLGSTVLAFMGPSPAIPNLDSITRGWTDHLPVFQRRR